jgi:hypothetical protein
MGTCSPLVHVWKIRAPTAATARHQELINAARDEEKQEMLVSLAAMLVAHGLACTSLTVGEMSPVNMKRLRSTYGNPSQLLLKMDPNTVQLSNFSLTLSS